MRRLIGGLLAPLLMLACPSTFPPKVTPRTPEMSNFEFLALAEKQVEEKFPQWYVKDLSTYLEYQGSGRFFAEVYELKDGTVVRYIYQPSLELTTVEDLASVLLHEYVHVKLWPILNASIPDPSCRDAVNELIAYTVELSQDEITLSEEMRLSSQSQRLLYTLDVELYCPEGFTIDEFMNAGEF